MSNGNGWMPLYIGDYLGDTMELDGAQHGAYLLLLMYYWRNGPLPLDDAKLAQIARTELRLWKKTVGPVVRAFFTERDGRLHQKRADLELAKAAECHERAAEKRQTDNDRLKAWRAKQSQDASHPREKANGQDPPETHDETRFKGVSPPVSERVAKRTGNADETRSTGTSTSTVPGTEEIKSLINKKPLSSNLLDGTGTREKGRLNSLPPDQLKALLDELDTTNRWADDEEPSADPAVSAAIRRIARSCRMAIPYGEVRSADAQHDAIKAQPAVVGADEAMGLKWQPAEPQHDLDAQRQAALDGISPEQLAKAQAAFAARAAPRNTLVLEAPRVSQP